MSSIWSRFVDWERHLAKLSQLGSTQATTPPLVYTPLHPPIRTELAILLISQQWNITQTAWSTNQWNCASFVSHLHRLWCWYRQTLRRTDPLLHSASKSTLLYSLVMSLSMYLLSSFFLLALLHTASTQAFQLIQTPFFLSPLPSDFEAALFFPPLSFDLYPWSNYSLTHLPHNNPQDLTLPSPRPWWVDYCSDMRNNPVFHFPRAKRSCLLSHHLLPVYVGGLSPFGTGFRPLVNECACLWSQRGHRFQEEEWLFFHYEASHYSLQFRSVTLLELRLDLSPDLVF